MRQIVYISTAASTFQTADLGPLLYEARYSNLRAGVTGALLFDGKQFLQALEGEFDDVRATYERISRDKRHTKIEGLSDRHVELREFGNWDMATRICNDSNFTASVDDLTRYVSCPKIRLIFENFGTTK
jgi:Sensors of blue-light using FAD